METILSIVEHMADFEWIHRRNPPPRHTTLRSFWIVSAGPDHRLDLL